MEKNKSLQLETLKFLNKRAFKLSVIWYLLTILIGATLTGIAGIIVFCLSIINFVIWCFEEGTTARKIEELVKK